MSRIGKLPIEVPSSVKLNVLGSRVEVSGPKGSIARDFNDLVEFSMTAGVLRVTPRGNSRNARAVYGTARSIVNGMIVGVQTPYVKDLEIQGVGFKASLKGKILDLSLGYSHPINYVIPEGIEISIKDNTMIHIEGVDKFLVGRVAAEIKSYYPVEPYKGKGVRVVGEHVRRKEGKKSAK